MADFQYRMRGQGSPQGKQRVYFTCHPADFERYFEEILRELLDRQDCAVFYLEPDTQPEAVADYELRLREMQLFVVPVTTKLLTTPNRAMDVEIPFALANHIPVLPLMQEGGLDDVFTARFGDLQYLDRQNTDPTAIPYEEKLTKYLRSVIIGDELARQVRAAFDAYIFLSYRKKDRRYAQELMRLIHSNPLCRDIAIWYDEFLTPGESFNDAIRAALEKSELFALAVTPNLVNEINYILNIEYPLARELGKRILPAEMQETDRDKLRELYADIPAPVDSGDTEALAKRLSELLGTVAVAENDGDPQHNFFIGLAYLSGIDVETDHARAVELITGAAEQDYIPAIEKLVAMYNNGEGVARDYQQAITWQERLVAVCRRAYADDPCKETAGALTDALEDLGVALTDAAMHRAALETYLELYRFAREYSERFQAPADMSVFLSTTIGEVYEALGQLEQAEAWYRQGAEAAEALSRETDNELAETVREYFCECCRRMSDVSVAQGKTAQARAWVEKALAVSGDGDDYLLCCDALCELCEAEGQIRAAMEWCGKKLDAAEARKDSEDMRETIAETCRRMGSLLVSCGSPEGAQHWYERSVMIYAQLAKETDDLDEQLRLYRIIETLYSLQFNKWMNARDACLEAVAIAEKLTETTGTIRARQQLADACFCLANCLYTVNLGEAEENALRAAAIYEELLRTADAVALRRRLSGVYAFLCLLSSRSVKPTEKEVERIAAYVANWEALAAETDALEDRVGLCSAYSSRAALAERQRKIDEAEAWQRKAVAAWKEITEQTDAPIYRKRYAEACRSLSISLKRRGKTDEAQALQSDYLAILEKLTAVTDAEEFRQAEGASYYLLGQSAEMRGDWAEAKENFIKEAAVFAADGTGSAYHLAETYIKVGKLCEALHQPAEAEVWYRRALDVAADCSAKDPKPVNRTFLCLAYRQLGKLLADRELLEKGLAVAEALSREIPDSGQFRRYIGDFTAALEELRNS